jgi:ABC-2 type transport system permease protein
MLLVGFTFSCIGLFLATLTKSSSGFQVMVSVIVLPLTLFSGALIPVTAMPAFLKPLIFFNPLSYAASIFRFIALGMETLSTDELIRQGVALQFNNLLITPVIALFIIIIMNILFFALCVHRFNGADFSSVKVFRHGR